MGGRIFVDTINGGLLFGSLPRAGPALRAVVAVPMTVASVAGVATPGTKPTFLSELGCSLSRGLARSSPSSRRTPGSTRTTWWQPSSCSAGPGWGQGVVCAHQSSASRAFVRAAGALVSRSRGGPRIDHHLGGVERLLGELLVTTHPRRHTGGLGHTERPRGSHSRPGDHWAMTRPAGARGRERCRPRFQSLCSAPSIPW